MRSVLLLAATLLPACRSSSPPAASSTALRVASAAPPAQPPGVSSLAPLPVGVALAMAPEPDTVDSSPCPRDVALIANGENENRTSFLEGRGGYWYTYADDQGTQVIPETAANGGTFVMTPIGAQGTAYAARMSGTLGRAPIVFAGMGFGFVDPLGPYDARKYKGISFWAKTGAPRGIRKVRLNLPDRNTEPSGNVCTECFNDFGAYLELTDQWTRYVVPFASMKQQSGWGNPRPAALATDALYGVRFQVDNVAKRFEIWVDEIEFTGCSP